jgi:hypothetical protein
LNPPGGYRVVAAGRTPAACRLSTRVAQIVVTRARMRALAFVLLIGCSSYSFVEPKTPPIEPFAAPPSDLAQVCVIRPHILAGAVTFAVRDNGRLVGATKGASYFCYFAMPGAHHITSEGDAIESSLVTMTPGVRYYVHQRVKNVLGWVTSPLEWVPESEARAMIAKCDYRVINDVPDGEVRPPVNPVAAAAR